MPDDFTHAGVFSRHPGFELIGGVETDREHAKKFAARWKVPVTATLPAADVVCLCTPTRYHAEHLELLKRHRCRLIFAEKPLMIDPTNFGKPMAVNYLRRWEPVINSFRTEITGGRWGMVRGVVGYYSKGILNSGAHLIDLAQHLLGVAQIVWTGRSFVDHDPADPNIEAVLQIANAPFHLIPGHKADYSLFELQLVMEQGHVAIEQDGFQIRKRLAMPDPKFHGFRSLNAGSVEPTRLDEAMRRAADNIYDHLTTGAALMSTEQSAMATEELCRRLLHSTRPA